MPEDTLTFTIRLYDPKEKEEVAKSTSWAVFQIPREDLKMPAADFLAKYVTPALTQLKQLELA